MNAIVVNDDRFDHDFRPTSPYNALNVLLHPASLPRHPAIDQAEDFLRSNRDDPETAQLLVKKLFSLQPDSGCSAVVASMLDGTTHPESAIALRGWRAWASIRPDGSTVPKLRPEDEHIVQELRACLGSDLVYQTLRETLLFEPSPVLQRMIGSRLPVEPNYKLIAAMALAGSNREECIEFVRAQLRALVESDLNASDKKLSSSISFFPLVLMESKDQCDVDLLLQVVQYRGKEIAGFDARAHAIKALGEIGNPAAIDPLIEFLCRSGDLSAIYATIDSLGKFLQSPHAQCTRQQLCSLANDPFLRFAWRTSAGATVWQRLRTFIGKILPDRDYVTLRHQAIGRLVEGA